MARKREITAADLNKALYQASRDARRRNKALGLETLYEKDGYLVRLDPSGQEHKVKKIEKKKRTLPTRVIVFT